ncbi:hypothetical protein DOY81_009444, partial [Sarcophaga bullata]
EHYTQVIAKTDREERAVKSTPPQKSPPHSHVTCTLSPQESIQEEPEREINEGLPLIQRLQQMKIKNDPPHPVNDSSLPVQTTAPEINNKLENISNGSSNTNNSLSLSLAGTQVKPLMKVSFRQKIQALQKPDVDSEMGINAKTVTKVKDLTIERSSTSKAKREPPKSLSVGKFQIEKKNFERGCKAEGPNKFHKPIDTITNQITKPSTSTPIIASDTDTPIKPWSKLKLATLISSSYTSLATSNTSSDDFMSPMKIFSMGSIPQQIKSEENTSGKNLTNFLIKEPKISEKSKRSLKNGRGLRNAVGNQTKLYQSVFDLSPEYSGLPFVKRLKILNERQKLAELEKVLQTRSFSLDSSKSNTAHISEALYRCHSDTTGINSQFLTAYESSSTTSTNTSTSDKSKYMHHCHHHRLDTVQHGYIPLSPESNETFETRKLRSILKKYSYEREHKDTSYSCNDSVGENQLQVFYRDFSTEPTVEGNRGSVATTKNYHSKSMDNSSSDKDLKSPTTVKELPAYTESAMTPPNLLCGESVVTCHTTNNSTEIFQTSSDSIAKCASDFYPPSSISHSSCHAPPRK